MTGPVAPPVIEGYEYVRMLGQGGFSTVFLYRQMLPRRHVAVKVLQGAEMSERARAAFVAEANVMAQLSHPYIMRIHQAALTTDGQPYIVMEYCSGLNYSQLYRQAPFSVVDTLRNGIRLAGAVATAHRAGIVHRDIKPPNVLTNDYGYPVLSDFGLAVDLGGHDFLRDDGSIGLSIPWAPPEAFRDSPELDAVSDIYSLGATLYSLLAGRSPFEYIGMPKTAIDLIARIESGVPTTLGRHDVPQSLVSVVRKAMALRPEDRFPTAIDLGRALQLVEMDLNLDLTPLDVPYLSLKKADYPMLNDDLDRTFPRVPPPPAPPQDASPGSSRTVIELGEGENQDQPKVFVVHGHDLALRREVELFVLEVTGHRAVVLADEPNGGRTIIEKFEEHASTSDVAIVLLTPDDFGGAAGSDSQPRARQNVIFEMGYFVGRLGRRQVIPMNAGVENPSDISGLLYIDFQSQWKESLRKELRAAKVSIVG